jgi:NAD-dependent deacetylase
VGGLYDGRQTVDGVSIEAALSAGMFRSRPEITWKYMGEIEASARSKTFNRGHEVIAELERNKPRVWVLTQNIDGYHLAAGSRNVIEIHGTMRRIRCTQCGKTKEVQTYEGLQIPPHCESCSGLIRPDVVLFDEMLPEKATQTLERELRQGFELYVSIGTSSVFPYIIQPILYAQMVGLPTIEINPANKTDISKLVTVHVPIRAAEALDRIAQKIGL